MWGEDDGEIRFHPDEAVTGAIRTIFARFSELGSARQVWLWFRAQNLSFPMHPLGMVPTLTTCHQLRWITPGYAAIYSVLNNPVYAGAYVYGKTRNERYVDEQGTVKNEFVICPGTSGRSFFPDIMKGSLTGQRLKPFKRVCSRTSPLNSIRQVAP